MSLVEVRVPDLGDAKGVNVVDVLIKKGSEIRLDDPLITLETEKASMDVPSPVSGVVDSIALKKGDEVSAGALIATVQVADAESKPAAAATPAPTASPTPPAAAPVPVAAQAPAATAPMPAASQAPAAATPPAEAVGSPPPGAVD